jgi:ferredoxin
MRKTVIITLSAAATVLALGWIYQVDTAICNGCGICVYACPLGAIEMHGADAWIDPAICDGCGLCAMYCPRGAIYRTWSESAEEPVEPASVPAVWPNPCAETAYVTGVPAGERVRIFDMRGAEVAGTVSGGSMSQIDMSGTAAGTYLLVSDTAAVSFTRL